ncbi:hypothetical protein [Bosea sp. WAO]|uniref:hypothetical protein n=1 Tax=Bosea sp. WAO TaxID=406341 RepID=UPI0012ED52CC|nr:hypothetical protein [Bosea sp. WAO]
MTGPPFAAFANRYSQRSLIDSANREKFELFANSMANFTCSSLLENLVSGYDAVRFDAVNEAVSGAHRLAATELGICVLFSMRPEPLEWKTCFIEDSGQYVADSKAKPEERLTYLEYLLACCYEPFQVQWAAIEDRINGFLKASALRLTYRDLNFLPVDDERLMDEVVQPFWTLVAGKEWINVRQDMEGAVQQRDTGGPNAALLASRALESTIKIISDRRGWTHRKERGAANYIDNLASGGRFIDAWEGNLLKRFFAEVRNPEAHGAGSFPQPTLNEHQNIWAIEFCMISIKSLIRRS